MIRGILLRSATIGEVGWEIVPLGLFLAVTMSLALRRFQKRLD
jgi:hypothetical protein